VNLAYSHFAGTLITTLYGKISATSVWAPEKTIVGFSAVGPLAFSPTIVGVDVQYDVHGTRSQLAIAGETALSFSSKLKGRVTSQGVVGIAYSQELQSPFAVTVLSEIDLNKINEPHGVKYGVKLSLK